MSASRSTSRPVRRGSAAYCNGLTAMSVVLLGWGAFTAQWGMVVLGAAGATLGAGLAMRRLPGGLSWRSATWVTVNAAVIVAAVAVSAAFRFIGVGAWLIVGVAVLASGWVTFKVTGVRELPRGATRDERES